MIGVDPGEAVQARGQAPSDVIRLGCPLCGDATAEQTLRLDDRWLLTCARCGVRFTDRVGSDAALAAFYDRVLAHHGKAELLGGQPSSLLAIAREQADLMERVLGPRRQGRFLEVGCARGHLLEEMEVRGWEVVGVDVSATAVREARSRCGGTVIVGRPEEAPLQHGTFDRIAVFDVLAHLPDPVLTLRQLRRLMAPSGDLILSTVNEDWPLVPWMLRAFRTAPGPLRSLRAEVYEAQHYSYFGEGNIGRLLAASGFELRSLRPLEPLSTRFFIHQYRWSRRAMLLAMVQLDRWLGSSRKMLVHARAAPPDPDPVSY